MDFRMRISPPRGLGYGELLPPTPGATVSLEEFMIYQTVDPSNSSPKKRSRRGRVTSKTVAGAEVTESAVAQEAIEDLSSLETSLEFEEDLLLTGAEVEAVASASAIAGVRTPLKDPSYFEDLEVAAETPLEDNYETPLKDPSYFEDLEVAVKTPLPESPVLATRSGNELLDARATAESDQEDDFFTPGCSPVKMNPTHEQRPVGANRLRAAMSMSSMSSVPTPSTSHSQIFEDARQGKFRTIHRSDGVAQRRNPYEFEPDSEEEMVGSGHGPSVKHSNLSLHRGDANVDDGFSSLRRQRQPGKVQLSVASLEQLDHSSQPSLAGHRSQLKKPETGRFAIQRFCSASSLTSSDADGSFIGRRPDLLPPKSFTAKPTNSKASPKEFIQGEPKRGMEKSSAGYGGNLEKAGKLGGSNFGFALKHPITPIVEDAGGNPFYSQPVRPRNVSYESYKNATKSSASVSFPPRGVQRAASQGNAFGNSFPAAPSKLSPQSISTPTTTGSTIPDVDITADRLSSPVKEMQKNLRAAATTASRIPRRPDSSHSVSSESLAGKQNHSSSVRKDRASGGNISDSKDLKGACNSLESLKVSPKEPGQLSHLGKTANDAIRERAANTGSSSHYVATSYQPWEKKGESSRSAVPYKEEGQGAASTSSSSHLVGTLYHPWVKNGESSRSVMPSKEEGQGAANSGYSHYADASYRPWEKKGESSRGGVRSKKEGQRDEADILPSTPSGFQDEGERSADYSGQSHVTSRLSAEAASEEKAQELRKARSRFGFGVFRNMKDKHDEKKAKKVEEKGKGKEKMEHDPIDDPLSFELVNPGQQVQQGYKNLATIREMYAKVDEETACCGGILVRFDFDAIEDRINGFSKFYEMFLEEYIDSGKAAKDHRDAMRAARDAGEENYMDPDVYELQWYNMLGVDAPPPSMSILNGAPMLEQSVKDFAAASEILRKVHKRAHAAREAAEAALNAGHDNVDGSSHHAEH